MHLDNQEAIVYNANNREIDVLIIEFKAYRTRGMEQRMRAMELNRWLMFRSSFCFMRRLSNNTNERSGKIERKNNITVPG